MYIPNELKVVKELPYHNDIINNMIDIIFDVVATYFDDKEMFVADNFTLYHLDEYALGTNCHTPIFATFYLEIDQPLNYRPKLKPKSLKHNKFDIPDLYLPLSDIRTGLHDEFVKYLDGNNLIWRGDNSINIKSSVKHEDNTVCDYYFKIIPCLTYYNNDNVRGIVYYSGNDIQIEYPDKFRTNYDNKNKQTKNKYKDIILILKNILLCEKDINTLPSEIIETLVYNVPNQFLLSDNKDSLLKIINFIRNHSLKEFKTIDEQDYAFASIYRGMSPYYCKHILKIIERYISKN